MTTEELIALSDQYIMSTTNGFHRPDTGAGSACWDNDGKPYLDLVADAVCALGHSHPRSWRP